MAGNLLQFALLVPTLIGGEVGGIKTPSSAMMEEEHGLIEAAKAYQKAMYAYLSTEEGEEEYTFKNALRKAYLATKGSFEEIVEAASSHGQEISRRLHEWEKKCERGLLKKEEATLSLEEFIHKSADYASLYDKIAATEIFQVYMQAYGAFKNTVTSLLKKGVSADEITASLEQAGITEGKVSCWQKQDLPLL